MGLAYMRSGWPSVSAFGVFGSTVRSQMAVGATAVASSECDRPLRGGLSGQGLALMYDHNAAVEPFLDFHLSASVAHSVDIR